MRAGTVRLGVRAGRVDPEPQPQQPQIDLAAGEALKQAQLEADQARAAADKLAKQLEELKRQMPSEEERAQMAALRSKVEADEEARKRKEGEFDSLKSQMEKKHAEEVATLRAAQEAATMEAQAREQELNDTLVGRAFADATEWFGPNGKTVYIPSVAQAYFGRNVSVEVKEGPHGRVERKVIVRDSQGKVILDTKTGKPAEFDAAIGDLIMSHPQKNHMLRASMKSGSGSPGGAGGGQDIDLTKLKPSDFKNPEVRERVRRQQENVGGLVIGPAFDRK